MKSHLQPRTLFVQQHAQSLYASIFLDRTRTQFPGLCDAQCHHTSTYERPSVSMHIACTSVPVANKKRLWRIQIP
jgi:hypothetical protein